AGVDHPTDTGQNIRSTYPTWVDNRNTLLRGFCQSRVRPDFILAPQTTLLASRPYSSSVNAPPPFRCAVLGIITSNTGPECEFWRWGAVGSTE
ncbi:hypothetical protein BGX38DRAFT_1335053, partial [Terfezia claveryi]